MGNETKREILLSLSLMCFSTVAIIFIYLVAFFHWEQFWLQLKLYWALIALNMVAGFLFLLARKEIPKKSNLPGQITPGKIYAGKELSRQRKRGW